MVNHAPTPPQHNLPPKGDFVFPSEDAGLLVALANGYIPPEPLPPRPEQVIEERLAEGFVDWVGQLSVAALAAVIPGRGRPKSLSSFRFVPIIGHERYSQRMSLFALAYGCIVPSDVTTTYVHNGYTHNNGRPYIDAQHAIGLVKNDWLVAVASAGVDDDASIKIVQNQDVTSVPSRPGKEGLQDRIRTGLYDGFYWRDTLVEGWREIATKAGSAQLVIRSGKNDAVHKEVNSVQSHPAYDDVAQRMGFTPRSNGDWELSLGN